MDGSAYAQLVGSLLEQVAVGSVASGSGSAQREGESTSPSGRVAETGSSAGATLDLKRLNPVGMSLTDDEKEFAQKLAPLIGTPRTAKRLTNLYRLIRAGLPEDVLAGVLDTGEFEAILLLLAVLVGHPAEAHRFFDMVVAIGDDKPWSDVGWSGLPGLAEVQPHIRQLKKAGELKPWIPVVARYSFHHDA